MKHLTIKEWENLSVDQAEEGEQVITRVEADSLLRCARSASKNLRTGEEGDAVLADRNKYLRAGQVVGIVVTPQISLEILPKTEGAGDDTRTARIRQSLVGMLMQVLNLRIADGDLTRLDWQRQDLLEIIIRLFCDRLFGEMRKGLPRQYIAKEDDLRMLRGRLDIRRQFTNLATSPQILACRFEELSSDIPLNQVMCAAVRMLSRRARAQFNQRRLHELGLALADVSNIPVRSLRWDAILLDRTNAGWKGLVNLARMLLEQQFQSTTTGMSVGFSLLFEMNRLFEEFIGRTLQRTLGYENVWLQRMGTFAVTDERRGTRSFECKPDAYITHRGQDIIVDTKWKELEEGRPSASDVYQMMAYAQVYRCKNVILLYPHRSKTTPAGIAATYIVNGADGVRLTACTVDLSNVAKVGTQLYNALNEVVFGKNPRATSLASLFL